VAASPKPDITALMSSGNEVTLAMQRGIRDAIVRHKRANLPVVVWKENRIVKISADEALAEMDAADLAEQTDPGQGNATGTTLNA